MRSALTKVDGVISADVALPDKAVVKLKKDSKVTSDTLIAAIKKAGYGASLRDDKNEKKKG